MLVHSSMSPVAILYTSVERVNVGESFLSGDRPSEIKSNLLAHTPPRPHIKISINSLGPAKTNYHAVVFKIALFNYVHFTNFDR